jgi:ribonuclease D
LLKDLPTSSQRSVKVLTRPKQLESESKTLLKNLAGIVQAKASELDITPSALASRRDLEMVLENPAESRVLNGWRSIVIGEEILELLPTASISRDNAL